jgi:hypothetical protein
MPTHENRYQLEMDGVTVLQASECKIGAKEHTPFELYLGNQPNPELGRGNSKVNETTFKHATGLGEAANELSRWYDDYVDGVDVTKRGARLIVFDETGTTPIDTYEMQDCVPTKFELENHSASGTNASMFTFGLRPTRMPKL